MDQGEQLRDHASTPPPLGGNPSLPATADEAGSETPKTTHDSMVTVRLSEPPSLTLDTNVGSDSVGKPPAALNADAHSSMRGSQSTLNMPNTRASTRLRDSAATLPSIVTDRSLEAELNQSRIEEQDDDSADEPEDEVDWEQLEKKEDEQAKGDDADDNSTALLLARLEQENAKLATNPKSVKVQAVEKLSSSKPRPPSMAQLRQMVSGPTPPALRYSMLPPPPMTDLEFYAALVQDYQQTAARLPTLLSNKIRKGIPPPLRGVVWQSMSGARIAKLEEQYERFSGESSPYELIINKDLGRSFPGVDMFRDPEGDGQRMLGRVLRSFSLYDTKIGYCQGLAFLVGPLLMHMPDKHAFCVLVRLMERYDLRACFLPDLSGLHVRIYQFRELMRQTLPTLSAHMEELQVDPAYVSQWFLSFFAVTCPLPLLFRIYDVLFAEGASETLMRVALSLMRKNEARLLACTEMEDVMQLLLSRGLWDCYHYNADEFVQDFVSLTSVVSREKLSQLEQGYRESLVATTNVSRASEITTAATRFLGRIWASSTIMSPRGVLSPGLSAPPRPLSMLRRSASKQSLASTLNSIEASSVSVASTSSTEASTLSRGSSNTDDDALSRESTPVAPKATIAAKGTDDKHLHSQIEDLLTALSELQRDHTVLANRLQREKEEREEDRQAVQLLLAGLGKRSDRQEDTAEPEAHATTPKAIKNESDDVSSLPAAESDEAVMAEKEGEKPSFEDLTELLEAVESRFASSKRSSRSSMMETKQQLRDELAQARDQLASVMSQSQELSRRVYDLDQETATLKEQLRESHGQSRKLYQDKQRLEKQIHTMRTRASSTSVGEARGRELDSDWPSRAAPGGLREFKLGRSKSTPTHARTFDNQRVSGSQGGHELAAIDSADPAGPMSENDALLMELVQAKTAEAMAKQEAEEAKQKLEALRRTVNSGGSISGDIQTALAPAAGVFSRLTGQGAAPATENSTRPALQSSNTTPTGGGFWGWRR
ncbi:rab-GTPase-TBC domain-containing protein [Stachybotrys elegans]|uniref:Rab-GTPase-TBC domain-containing protein n=1 Tax=Stachybotrys elegans TaxID=80388 RepID=A0A8K0T131_9HYPO|nr:rab-GTPase-TBC domain-containing protein [Stachybotrys elegans]